MIKRPYYLSAIRTALSRSRVVVLTGPRQVGKTTLAREFCDVDSANYFDLEDPAHLAALDEPMTALRNLEGTVVIDEVQLRPELFPVIRVLADRKPQPAKFLILGSAAPQLLRQSSETLAGRVEIIEVSGFTLDEVGLEMQVQHWLRGGFPPKGRCWAVTNDRLQELIADNRIWSGAHGRNVPRLKKFLHETTKGLTPQTIWEAEGVGTTDSATKSLLQKFGGESKFDATPKPVGLIDRILRIATKPGDLVLDSFAGSGTTGHAVMQLNKEDGGNRRFILVEMDKNICQEVTAERLRRVSEGYENSSGKAVEGLGGGFRFATLAEARLRQEGIIFKQLPYRLKVDVR